MSSKPKYSLLEIERRWLVDLKEAENLDQCRVRHIEDRYINGTRLRLRIVEEEGKGAEYKLCKKYGRVSDLAEPITNLYLTEEEYKTFVLLPAATVDKLRYALAEGSIDIYEPEGIAVYEVEFDTMEQAQLYVPPPFALQEVTSLEGYSGYSLAIERT